MPLFREHRGTLKDSLLTTDIVRNREELKSHIKNVCASWISNFDFEINIYPPLPLPDCFDPRCGWYTHYVTADLTTPGKFEIVGMLSEPL